MNKFIRWFYAPALLLCDRDSISNYTNGFHVFMYIVLMSFIISYFFAIVSLVVVDIFAGLPWAIFYYVTAMSVWYQRDAERNKIMDRLKY